MLTPKSAETEQKQHISISTILESRNIHDLIHFTRVDNLRSILFQGILSRNALDKKRLNYTQNDSVRLDGKLDCSCLSVEFPNNFLFKKFRDHDRESNWAVLIIDASLLIDHKEELYFCYDNAARSDLRFLLRGEDLKGPQAFENMYCESYSYRRLGAEGTVTRNAIRNIKSYLPTSSQAEILVTGDIPPKYIKGIVFQAEDEIKQFDSFIKLTENCYTYENGKFVTVNNAYFIDRNDVKFNREGR